MLCPSCFGDNFSTSTSSCLVCGFQSNQTRESVLLPVGTILHNGEYKVGKVLGKPGGFGITYLALDTRLGIKVAVKEYLPFQIAARSGDGISVSIHTQEYRSDFEFGLEKFLEEAKTLAQFRHPNIVRVMNFFRENETAYLVMEYLEGESLDEYLARVGKLTGPDAVELFLPILDGLQHIHSKNVLHRDIKPSNIYLTNEGQAILLDFGSARQSMREKSQSLTTVITPGFAPWEQYHRKRHQGPWTDVYSCAATLYFMLTGKIPPDGAERAIDDEIEPLATLAPEIDANVMQAISQALAVKIEERPQTAGKLGEMLRRNKQAQDTENSKAMLEQKSVSQSVKNESSSVAEFRKSENIQVESVQKKSGVLAKIFAGGLVFAVVGGIYFGFIAKEKTPSIELAKTPIVAPNTPSTPSSSIVVEKNDAPNSRLDQYVALASVRKEFRERYGSGASLGDYIVLILTVRNKSAKDIDTMSSVATIRDLSGKELYSFALKNDAEIRAGQSQVLYKFIRFDRENNTLALLRKSDISGLKTEWRAEEVVLTDGTRIDSSGAITQSSGLNIEIPEKQDIFPPIPFKTANGKNGVVNLYASPNSYAAVIGTVKENTDWLCKNGKNGFVFIDRNGVKGWVKRENVVSAI